MDLRSFSSQASYSLQINPIRALKDFNGFDSYSTKAFTSLEVAINHLKQPISFVLTDLVEIPLRQTLKLTIKRYFS